MVGDPGRQVKADISVPKIAKNYLTSISKHRVRDVLLDPYIKMLITR
jgi:hypothetical protein